MTDKLKIVDHDDLVRDTKTQAVVSTDLSSLEQYRARRNRQFEMDEKLGEIDNLKAEISEIKDLLHLLVDRENNK